MAFAFRQPLIERGRTNRGLSTLLLVLVSFIMVVESRTIYVGNQMGWTNYDIKSFQVPDYIQWASSQHVRVGDELVFKYSRGLHNVNLLPDRSAYQSCDFSHAKVLDSGDSGGYVWKAAKEGVFYFGCNKKVEAEGNHCGSGQKFSIVVRSPLSTTLSSASITLPSSSTSASTLSSSTSGFQLASSPFPDVIAPVIAANDPTSSSASSPMSFSAPSMPPLMNFGVTVSSVPNPLPIIAASILSLLLGMVLSICN